PGKSWFPSAAPKNTNSTFTNTKKTETYNHKCLLFTKVNIKKILIISTTVLPLTKLIESQLLTWSISFTANLPNLPITSSNHPNITHLNHRRRKIGTKLTTVPTVFLHNSIRGSAAVKHLIRLQKPFLPHQRLKIVVIKRLGRHRIKRRKILSRNVKH
ncbi:hypothetical protein LINPERHAP1_LOCUS3772, partial [Linum perenne]